MSCTSVQFTQVLSLTWKSRWLWRRVSLWITSPHRSQPENPCRMPCSSNGGTRVDCLEVSCSPPAHLSRDLHPWLSSGRQRQLHCRLRLIQEVEQQPQILSLCLLQAELELLQPAQAQAHAQPPCLSTLHSESSLSLFQHRQHPRLAWVRWLLAQEPPAAPLSLQTPLWEHRLKATL